MKQAPWKRSQDEEVEAGKVLLANEISATEAEADEVHPKLRNISPDSKEEAEVFYH